MGLATCYKNKPNFPSSHKWPKLHLYLQGMWSDFAWNSINCIHTLPNNTSFPQRFPFVTPIGNGVKTGAN